MKIENQINFKWLDHQ